jgi:DNA topoisomerase III
MPSQGFRLQPSEHWAALSETPQSATVSALKCMFILCSESNLGSCQFPTLGFVVDRYFRVKNFVPENFWGIKVTHKRDDINVVFNWARNRLFDRAAVIILFERCIAAKTARVTKVQERPTSKWKPLPLTTVELQKVASRLLRMNSQQAMSIAESLYNKGFISYPRTETDRFDKGMNLRALVEKQTPDNRWGAFAQNLVHGAFKQPREGRHDDKAHPPIHPIAYCAPAGLNPEEGRVYEFITRRFLACCSEDAKGKATDVELEYGDEMFHTRGVIVLERNYLDVYPYENWTNSTILPKFTLDERFAPTEAMITDGKTSAPGYLTEPDLIALMDANGIGTDATMAEHIAKVKNRNYVFTRPKAGRRGTDGNDDNEASTGVRGGRGSRGSRGGRGGRRGGGNGGGGGGGGVEEFIPSTLGVALVEGYDRMGFETSLSKPFLRKELELRLKAICEGRISRAEVMRESLQQYKSVFMESKERVELLKAVCYIIIIITSITISSSSQSVMANVFRVVLQAIRPPPWRRTVIDPSLPAKVATIILRHSSTLHYWRVLDHETC